MSQLNKFRFANIVIGLVFAAPFAATTFAQSRPTPTPRPVASATEITPPPGVAVQARPNSVTLRAGPHSANIQALTIKRQFEVNQLRANPVITLGRTKVNLASVFNNPSALPNVAMRLRAMPQLAEVMTDDMQVLEVSQGLILHHFLSYRLKPGVCSDSVRRSALPSSGIRCAAKITDETRAAAFATKGNAHYIADPRQRAIAIADATKKSAAMRLQVAANLVKLRATLSNPAERAKIDSLRGAGEAARLSALSDEQLKAEIINSAVTKIEQVTFVPSADKLDEIKKLNLVVTGLAIKPAVVALESIRKAPAAASTPDASPPDRPLHPQIFLTGFTLGRDYEWRQRVEKTVSWCIVGCDETYYAEAYAGFNYGLGLRFPIKLDGTYHYSNGKANVTTNFTPFNGGPADYIAAGLNPGNDQSKYPIFNGKELVAQFDAYAGGSYCLPTVAMAYVGLPGCGGIRIDIGKDFTEDLTGDFANGQFTPPAPGQPGPTMNKVFDDFDLIGGRLNFGIIGAQVFPAVQVGLHSDSLQFTLTDNVWKKDTTLNYSTTAQTTPLGLDNTNSASFTIRDPLYNLTFDVTPGIDAHAFIDIEVWSDSWDWFIWFPQLAIHLPPGDGATFSCHLGTSCSRDYGFTPTTSTSTAGPAACKNPGTAECFDSDADNWGKGFDAQWLPQCVDDTCKFGIKLVHLGTVLNAKQQHEANTKLQFSDAKVQDVRGPAAPPLTQDAQVQARTLIQQSQGRQTASEIEADANLALAIWSAKCSDKLCFDNVAAITHHEQVDVGVRHGLAPDESILSLFGKVSKEYGNKQLQAEIDASTARAAAAARPAMRIRRPS